MTHICTIRNGMTQCDEKDLSNIAVAFSTGGGVVGGSDYLVQAQGSPNNTVQVGTGRAYIPTTDGTMVYSGYNNASINVTIAANNTGSSQIDSIVLYPDLSVSPNAAADNVMKLADVRGTGGIAPTNAQILTAIGSSNPYIILANVTCANGFTSINSGNISDQRAFSKISGGDTVFQSALSNFVSSGISIPTSASLASTSTSGVIYFGGIKVAVASDGGHTYTANQDTYVDVSNTGLYTYNGVSNGAAAPALTANSIRVAKVVSAASTITSVVQDGIDSLSNLIYPSTPLNLLRMRKPLITDEYDNGTQGGTYNIDWSRGDRQRLTISSALTLTYTNFKRGQVLTLDLDENGTGNFAITFPANTIWPNGVAQSPITTPNALNTIVVKCDINNKFRTQLAAGWA